MAPFRPKFFFENFFGKKCIWTRKSTPLPVVWYQFHDYSTIFAKVMTVQRLRVPQKTPNFEHPYFPKYGSESKKIWCGCMSPQGVPAHQKWAKSETKNFLMIDFYFDFSQNAPHVEKGSTLSCTNWQTKIAWRSTHLYENPGISENGCAVNCIDIYWMYNDF